MKTTFKFSECLITEELLDALGFSEYWDSHGTSGERRLHLEHSFITLEEFLEEDDINAGYSPYGAERQVHHFGFKHFYKVGTPNIEIDTNYSQFESIYFIHEIWQLIYDNSREDIEEFEKLCYKANIKWAIDSYKKYKEVIVK